MPIAAGHRAAVEHLAGVDPVMADLVARHGPPRMRARPTPRAARFAALVESITYQQLAGTAAAAIHRRVVEALGGVVSPETVLSASAPLLRAAGLSGSKATAITSLAQHVSDGSVRLERLGAATDAEVVAELTLVHGIGPWTAQMFLMFDLARPDVWPVLDYGVRAGYARAYGWAELPTPRELAAAGEVFAPFRSAAAWYLWRVVDTTTR